MKTLMNITAALVVGITMIWGNRVMGGDSVTVTLKEKKVKVGGKISGTHSATAGCTFKDGSFSGNATGKVKKDGSIKGKAGKTPSTSVGDTVVTANYVNKKEQVISGFDKLTVVGIRSSLNTRFSDNGMTASFVLRGVCLPSGLGNCNGNVTAIGEPTTPAPPFVLITLTNRFVCMRTVHSNAYSLVGAILAGNVNYSGFNFGFTHKL